MAAASDESDTLHSVTQYRIRIISLVKTAQSHLNHKMHLIPLQFTSYKDSLEFLPVSAEYSEENV